MCYTFVRLHSFFCTIAEENICYFTENDGYTMRANYPLCFTAPLLNPNTHNVMLAGD